MKFYLSLVILIALSGCLKDENLNIVKSGYYVGYFEYQGIHYYSSVILNNNDYSEGASGGVVYQKNPASLTEGRYFIYEGNIIFNPQHYQMNESEIWKRNPDLILDGAFKIIFLKSDSISFARGSDDKKIVYLLRRYIEKN